MLSLVMPTHESLFTFAYRLSSPITTGRRAEGYIADEVNDSIIDHKQIVMVLVCKDVILVTVRHDNAPYAGQQTPEQRLALYDEIDKHVNEAIVGVRSRLSNVVFPYTTTYEERVTITREASSALGSGRYTATL